MADKSTDVKLADLMNPGGKKKPAKKHVKTYQEAKKACG